MAVDRPTTTNQSEPMLPVSTARRQCRSSSRTRRPMTRCSAVRHGGAPAGRVPRPARGDPDQGRLPARPDPRELALAVALGPVVLRDRDDEHGNERERHRSLRDVPVPRQPAPGRCPDRGRHADDEDGRPAGSALGADAGAEVVSSPWVPAPPRAGASSAATASSRASIASCRSTSMSQAARRARRG